MIYDGRFQERVVLSDGKVVDVRLLRPADRRLIAEGLSRLSSESRRLRFFGQRARFSESELTFLTDLDHWDHVAIGASMRGPDGTRGAGVARFIRDAPSASSAEMAVVVADEHQGRGLGRALLEHLRRAARERGVRAFRGEVLAENTVALRMLRSAGAIIEPTSNGRIVSFRVSTAAEARPFDWMELTFGPPSSPVSAPRPRRRRSLVAKALGRREPDSTPIASRP